MKKYKLLVAVVTTKIYEYNTDAKTADVAYDEWSNQSGLKLKMQSSYKTSEIVDFIPKVKNGQNKNN